MRVAGRTSYDIQVESGLAFRSAPLLVAWGIRRVRVVADDTVNRLYGERLETHLLQNGLEVARFAVPSGEAHKTLDQCRDIYRFLADSGADRHTAVLPLGGGVVGDMAGFAAATYMRGVPLVQMPTTLLAMVDSSIGSKVAVDLPQGKNLVGAFYDPLGVLIDPDFLATLPPRELAGGMAEAIKAGVIASRSLFERCAAGPGQPLEPIVREAAQIKADVVSRDPFEKGERMQLNLGHTLGHAIEAATGYSALTHGEAVAIGMVAALRLARRLEVLQEPFELEACLTAWGLPVRAPALPWDALAAAMRLDKKRADGRLRYVVPRRAGEVVVLDDVPLEAVKAVYEELV